MRVGHLKKRLLSFIISAICYKSGVKVLIKDVCAGGHWKTHKFFFFRQGSVSWTLAEKPSH
jgi:hypothetical protein